MLINEVLIEVRRTAGAARVRMQAKPFAVETAITLEQMDRLISEFIGIANEWRRSLRPDYYATLGVARHATQAEIATAYRAVAKTVHPDMEGGEVSAMQGVNDAYATLSNSEHRAQYDQQFISSPTKETEP